MDPKRSQQVEELLNAALLIEPSKRLAWMDAISDPEIRAEVASRLTADAVEGTLPLDSVIAAAQFNSGRPPDGIPAIGDQFERYRVLRVIGEGGMGKVYLAEQTEPVQRTVALKIIRPGMASEHIIARFEAERQVLAMMDHPNIAKVLDAGSTPAGQPYFVMELVDGPPITEYCDIRRFSIRDRLNLFIPVCRAVQHAHQKGIIHRDIKPSNILVATYDGKPVPKVIDFGVAKATEKTPAKELLLTRIGAVIGTFAYMSPEQANSGSRDVDTRSDVYSLGAVLYELLTGATPIDIGRLAEAGYLEMLRHVCEDEPQPPSSRLVRTADGLATIAEQRKTDPGSLERTIHGELDWIVMKAIEKDRSLRYATANGLVQDLERYLNGEALEAGPASATYRLQKFARKHLALLTTVAAFLALLVISASVSIWQAVRANRERDTAVHALHVVTAEKLAIPAIESLSTDAERSILLAMHAVNATTQFHEPPTPAAEGALHAAILSSRIRATLRGHNEDVRALAFSTDGRHIVTGGDDGLVKTWDAASGRELLSFKGHGRVSGIAFSPDGTRVATANPDQTATLWNAITGAEVISFHGHQHPNVTAVAFSPDGGRLATASLDRTARVWDVATGRELRAFRGHTDGVWGVAFSPDGTRLATASDDATARVWNIRNGRELLRLRGHQRAVVSVAFSGDGKRLASSSTDRTARVWEAESGKELVTVRDEASMTWVTFSPDGHSLATAGLSAKIWDSEQGKELFAFRGRAVSKLAFSPTGDRLAVASAGHKVEIQYLGPGVEFATIQMPAAGAGVFSPDRARFATVDRHGMVKLWEVSTGRLLLTVASHKEPISDLKFSPDGTRLATSSYDGTAKIQDSATGRELLVFRGHKDKVTGIAFSPDGKRIATVSADKTGKLWDALTGRELLTLSGHKDRIRDVGFSPDGKRIATASSDGTLRVWDSGSGRSLFTLGGHDSMPATAAFSPDGKHLAALGWDRGPGTAFPDKVWVWSAVDGREQFTLHTRCTRMAFSPDGTRLATAAYDTEMWDAQTGQHLFSLPGLPSAFKNRKPGLIVDLGFTPNAKRLTTAEGFGSINVYAINMPELMALARTRVTRSLTPEECQRYFQSPVCPALP